MDSTNHTKKPSRAAKVDARCSEELRRQLEIIAAARDIELSDVVRDALRHYVMSFMQQLKPAI